jgi:flagellar assembly factor FliW
MPMTFQSVRFGSVEVPDDAVLEFPFGLIGLGGLSYAIVEPNVGSGFFWLHSTEDPALALPIVKPDVFFPDFALEMSETDRERTGIEDPESAPMYVTVRAAPDPMQTTANLRAPIVIRDGKGFQVLNEHDPAPLQAPLFELAAQPAKEPAAQAVASADAA